VRRINCGLLPHIREDIYGLNLGSAQLVPWALNEFNIPDSWNVTKGGDVRVAVIDTGCDLEHPDLYDNLALPGYNATKPGTYPSDHNGHGSHVAGTIGAVSNKFGVVGVAPKVKIIPIKALGDNGMGNNNHVADGVKAAVQLDADLITMSLGSPYRSPRLESSLKYAHDHGIGIFCAAGNSGNHNKVNYPASSRYTVAIGSIGRKLEVSKFSCTGETLDFVAPGEDIISCVPEGYARLSGTSMATPYAVGIAALTLSYLKGRKMTLPRTSDDWVELLSKNCMELPNENYRKPEYQGNGIPLPVFE
jgi:subtilisin family serine protease